MNTEDIKDFELDTQLLGVAKDALPRISLEGCEIVRRQYLSHIKDNILTIRPDGIQFNSSCLMRLPETTHVYLIIDRKKKWFIITACDEDDKDGQKWCNEKAGKRIPRKITGKPFTDRLYQLMDWKKGFYYKVCGTPALRVEDEDQLLIIFELDDAEIYPLSRKGRASAGIEDDEISQEDLAKLDEYEKQVEAAKQARKEAKEAGLEPKKAKKQDHFPENWDKQSFGVLFDDHKGKVEMPRITKEDLLGDMFLLGDAEENSVKED